jgi:adenylosuccinate synthase
LQAYVIVDLGFGDAGKGVLTDFLVRRFKAGLVVRYNGGAQAGHNVVAPDGRHHTFSQFGSGTFIPGVKTYLSRHVVIHPGALLVEGDILVGKGVRDAFSRLRMSDQALIVTPFHQAANRIREMARGEDRHGSCGVGVGEAVEDEQLNGADSVVAGDLSNPPILRRKLRSIRELKQSQLVEQSKDKFSGAAIAKEWEIFKREEVLETWISSMSRIGELGLVTPDSVLRDWLDNEDTVIFEGAQGVLLDAEAGFHPYTTWSRTTSANACELIQEMAPDSQIFKIGVMRSYAVRHGPGPLPTETDDLTPVVSEHNQYNDWQGKVRYGWFDAVLARYALGVTGGVDTLAVTYLEVLPRLKKWNYCDSYKWLDHFEGLRVDSDSSEGTLSNFRLRTGLSLSQRERITQALLTAAPVVDTSDAVEGEVVHQIEALLGQRVGIVSTGPRAANVKILQV